MFLCIGTVWLNGGNFVLLQRSRYVKACKQLFIVGKVSINIKLIRIILIYIKPWDGKPLHNTDDTRILETKIIFCLNVLK